MAEQALFDALQIGEDRIARAVGAERRFVFRVPDLAWNEVKCAPDGGGLMMVGLRPLEA